MADVEALLAKIVELGRTEAVSRGGRFNVNDLYARLAAHFEGDPPVSRATLYSWFGNGRTAPKQSLLECVPAFAAIFLVPEHELWQAAGILPAPMDASLAIASVVHDLRAAHRRMNQTLANSGLSTAGEALVVDRILHARLDYRMSVWPVVRGKGRALHLHSRIALEPLSNFESTPRNVTATLQSGQAEDLRRYLRHEVIKDGLWRTLGLSWLRPAQGVQDNALIIEVPVEERNRKAPPAPLFPHLRTDHIVILGAPWAHAELMAALLADALQFGSWDLRYLGLEPGVRTDGIVRFCRETLAERRSRHILAISQRAQIMKELRADIREAAAPPTLMVLVTYGPRLAGFAASALRSDVSRTTAGLDEVRAAADDLTGRCDLVHVDIDDDEVLGPPGVRRDEPEVRDRMVDHIRHLTAGVLDHLYWHRAGPGLTLWGDRFDDLRLGDEESVQPPLGRSQVRWNPVENA